MVKQVFHKLPSSFIVEKRHHVPSCEHNSSLPPDELGNLWCFSGISRHSHYVRCGGCIVLVWIYCPLCMCKWAYVCLYLCVCGCVCLVRVDSETVPLCKWAVKKPTGLTASYTHSIYTQTADSSRSWDIRKDGGCTRRQWDCDTRLGWKWCRERGRKAKHEGKRSGWAREREVLGKAKL